MKVLVYSVNALMRIVNFGAELDIIKSHIDDGDDVHVLGCRGELPSCHTNPRHFSHKCYLCKKRFEKGMRLVDLPSDCLHTLSEDGVDYTRLPTAFADMETLCAFTLDDVNLGLPAVASLVMELKDHKFDVAAYRDKIHEKLCMAYLVHVNIRRVLDEVQPDLVYVFNGRLAETRPVVYNCVQRGVKVLSIDRAGTQGRYALYPNDTAIGIPAWQDMFRALWDEAADDPERRVKLADEFYTVRRQGIDTGDPSFVKKQQQNLLPAGFDRLQKNIGIYIMSEYEFAGDPDRKNPLYADQRDGIVRITEALHDRPEYKIWVRCHPNITFLENLQLIELRELEAQGYPNVGIIWPAEPVDSYGLIDACDKVITFGSTVGIEATYWGRPSILAGRSLYEDLGSVYRPKSHEELMALLLTEDLPPADVTGAQIYAHGLMTNGEPYRYFTQTSVYDGHWQGETFESSLRERLVAYGMRKLDKQRRKKMAAAFIR